MLHAPDKIKVIFIVGTTHSGSTLLDMIIGSAPEAFSMGELAFYNIYRNQLKYKGRHYENRICGCLKEHEKCDFWNSVKTDERLNIRKVLTVRQSLLISIGILFPFLKIGSKLKDDTFSLLQRISEKAGYPEYLVDSSKDPRRLYTLMQDSRIELYPVVLVRSPLAIGFTYVHGKRVTDGIGHAKGNFFGSSIKAASIAFFSWLLAKRNPHSVFLTYEMFCSNPKQGIQRLNQALGIHIDGDNFVKRVNEQVHHNLDGNRIRHQELTGIHFDERWKRETGIVKKALAYLLVAPFLWVYADIGHRIRKQSSDLPLVQKKAR
jgi:hypothetical protein